MFTVGDTDVLMKPVTTMERFAGALFSLGVFNDLKCKVPCLNSY